MSVLRAADSDLAATATNQLGIDLHRQLATGDENLCVSPYSIQSALAMTFAGADGETRAEMARVLAASRWPASSSVARSRRSMISYSSWPSRWRCAVARACIRWRRACKASARVPGGSAESGCVECASMCFSIPSRRDRGTAHNGRAAQGQRRPPIGRQLFLQSYTPRVTTRQSTARRGPVVRLVPVAQARGRRVVARRAIAYH